MLTCNKNFVDLTVWILRSCTCIKLNVMIHESLEKEREPGDGPVDQTKTPSSHRHTGPDWIEMDFIGVCSALLGC